MTPNYRSKPVEVFAFRPEHPPKPWSAHGPYADGAYSIYQGNTFSGCVRAGDWAVFDSKRVHSVPDSNGSPEGYEPLEGT